MGDNATATTAAATDSQTYLIVLLGGSAGVIALTIIVIACWYCHYRRKPMRLRNRVLGNDTSPQIPAIRLSVGPEEDDDDINGPVEAGSGEDTFDLELPTIGDREKTKIDE